MSDTAQLVPRELVPGNSFSLSVAIEKPSLVVGDRFRLVPDTGLAVTAFLALDGGAAATAIHATLSVSLAEVGTTGTYAGAIPGAAITAQLAAYVGTTTPIWCIVTDGTALREVIECRVVKYRTARGA